MNTEIQKAFQKTNLIGAENRDERLARHVTVATATGFLLLGANVAIGAEIRKVAAVQAPRKGRPKKGEVVATWGDAITAATGKSLTFCNRARRVADDLALRLKGKRDEDSARARKILDDPDACHWGAEDYELLGRVAGYCYDAVIWTELLQEMGIIRTPPSPSGKPPVKQNRLPLAEEARITGLAFLQHLRTFSLSDEKRKARLAALPLEPTGDPEKPSLTEVREALAERLREVEAVIGEKDS